MMRYTGFHQRQPECVLRWMLSLYLRLFFAFSVSGALAVWWRITVFYTFYHILFLNKFTLTMFFTSNFQYRTQPPIEAVSELIIHLCLNTSLYATEWASVRATLHYCTSSQILSSVLEICILKLEKKQI